MPIFSAGSASVSIVPDFAGAQKAISEFFARQSDIKATVHPELSNSDVVKTEAALNAMHGTATVEVDRDALGASIASGIQGAMSLSGLDRLGGILTAAISPTIVTAIGGAFVELAAAASQAVGAIALVPAGIAAIATPAAVVALGVQGMGAAFKALDSGNIDKINAAMANLAPSAQQVVTQIHALTPAWTDMRLDVQQSLFAGVGTAVTNLANVALPILHSGLVDVAGAMNTGLLSAITTLQGKGAEFTTMFSNIADMIKVANGAIAPLISAFATLGAVGSQFLPGLAQDFVDLAQKFDGWVQRIAASGQLTEIIKTALDVLKQLGDLVLNVGGILTAVFTASAGAGSILLDLLVKATGALSVFLHSADGQAALQAFFTGITDALNVILPAFNILVQAVVTNVLPAIGQLAALLAPIAAQILVQLAAVLNQVGGILPPVAVAVAALASAFAPLIPVIGDIITALLPPLVQFIGQLAPIIGTLAGMIGQALLQAVTIIAPYLTLLGDAFIQILNALLPLVPPLLQLAVSLLPPLLTIVGALVPVLVSLVTQGFVPLIAPLIQIVQVLIPPLVQIINALVPLIPPLAAAFIQVVNAVLPLLPLLAQMITTLLPPLISIITPLIKLIGEAMVLAIKLWADEMGLIVGIITTVYGAILDFLNNIGSIWNTTWSAVSSFFSTVWNGIKSFAETVWGAIASAFQTTLGALGTAWSAVWGVALTVWNALAGAIQVAWNDVIKPVWDAIVIAAKLLFAVVVTLVLTPILVAWNILSSAIQDVWTGIIQPVWQAMQTFAQAMWTGVIKPAWDAMKLAWDALATGLKIAYDTVIAPMWQALQAAWQAVSDFLVAGWNVLSATWTNIWNAISSFVQTVWNAIASFFSSALATFITGWQNAWNLVSNFFSTIWNAISAFAQTIWNAIASFFTGAWAVFSAAWSVFWNAISSFFSTIWNAISAFAQTIWNAIASFFSGAWAVFTAAWAAFWNPISAFFSTIWGGISTTAQTVWGDIVTFFTGVWGTFTTAWGAFWDGVSAKFGLVWDGIKAYAAQVWDGIKAVVAVPINFVIGTILNGGLFKAWNAVNDFLHLPFHIDDLPLIPGFAQGGYTGEAGLFGTGGPEDPAGVVHAKEFVFTANQVDNAGGPDAMYSLASQLDSGYAMGGLVRQQASDPQPHLNSYVVPPTIAPRVSRFLDALSVRQAEAVQAAGGFDAIGPGFFYGGAVDGLSAAKAVATAMNGQPYVWGGVGPNGADCSGFQSALTNALRGANNPFSRVGTTANFPWPGFTSGLTSSYGIGSTKDAGGGVGHMAGTLDGVNVESGGAHNNVAYGGPAAGATAALFNIHASLPEAGGVFAPGASVGGTEAAPPTMSILGKILASAGEVLGALTDSITGPVGDLLSKFSGNKFVSIISAMPKKLLGGMWDIIKDKVTAYFTTFAANVSGSGVTPSGGTSALQNQAYQIAAGYGWTSQAEKDAINYIVTNESNWNPTAQNPTSTASGLWQLIDATWAAYRPNTASQYAHAKDAATDLQDDAGLSYIQARYGDPVAAQAYWQAHHNYDSGGPLPPGYTGVMNQTGGFEYVLNQAKMQAVAGSVLTPRYDAAPTWHFYLGDREITDLVDARVVQWNDRDGRNFRSSM